MLELATCSVDNLADKRRKNLSLRRLDHDETATRKFIRFVAGIDGHRLIVHRQDVANVHL